MMALLNKAFLLALIISLFYGFIFPILVSTKSDTAVGLGFGGLIVSIYLVCRSIIKCIQKEIKNEK